MDDQKRLPVLILFIFSLAMFVALLGWHFFMDETVSEGNSHAMASAGPLPMAFCPWELVEARAYEKETGRKPIIASCN